MSVLQNGVEHLYGNLYRVEISLIQFAQQSEDGGLAFFNPRFVLANSKPKGLTKDEMNELREAIRTEGLENPLLLRRVEIDGEQVLQLVGGERRKRCLDKLIADEEECFDPASETWKSASEMYGFVECRINEMDDQSAYKYAFSENERAIGIGDGATVALINEFRKASWTDEQILQTTGKSSSWLRETDILLNLDESTFKSLSTNEITRAAALKLAKIEDIEARINVLESARSFAFDRIASIKEKLEAEVEATEDRIERNEAEAFVGEIQGDLNKKASAEKKLRKNKERVEAKKEEIEDLAPKINTDDIFKAADTESVTVEEDNTLTNVKLAKFWLEPLALIVEREGLDEDGNDLGIDLADVKLVLSVFEARKNGEKDILGLLQDHKVNKSELNDDDYDDLAGDVASSLDDDDDDEDEDTFDGYDEDTFDDDDDDI